MELVSLSNQWFMVSEIDDFEQIDTIISWWFISLEIDDIKCILSTISYISEILASVQYQHRSHSIYIVSGISKSDAIFAIHLKIGCYLKFWVLWLYLITQYHLYYLNLEGNFGWNEKDVTWHLEECHRHTFMVSNSSHFLIVYVLKSF